MKRIALIIGILSLSLCSCSLIDELSTNKKATTTTTQETPDVPVTIATQEKPEEENVTITLPSAMFDNAEEYAEGLRSRPDKVVSAEVNDDDSITATFTPQGYQDVCDGAAQSVTNALGDILNSGDYPILTAIDYNADFTEYDVYVDDPEEYTSNINQRMYLIKLKVVTGLYHHICRMDNADPVVHVLDQTGTEIATTHLNDVLDTDNITRQ